METLLYCAAGAALLIGLAHSILGERYILTRLFRRNNLPRLFGSTQFTRRTLRFAWHITTVCFWGFAAILVLMAWDALTQYNLSLVLGCTFLLSGGIALIASRGKHVSWVGFLFIGGVCIYSLLV